MNSPGAAAITGGTPGRTVGVIVLVGLMMRAGVVVGGTRVCMGCVVDVGVCEGKEVTEGTGEVSGWMLQAARKPVNMKIRITHFFIFITSHRLFSPTVSMSRQFSYLGWSMKRSIGAKACL